MLRSLAIPVALLGCVACHTTNALKERVLPEPTRHLAVAEGAGQWLVATAQRDGSAWTWSACPDVGGAAVHNLYSGGSGATLLFAELHAATGEGVWLDAAHAAARGLAKNVDDVAQKSGGGLFTGIGGMLLAMQVVYEQTGDRELDAAIESGMAWYWQRAKQSADGAAVSFGPVTDIISGDAGIGELMLWLAGQRQDPRATHIAAGLARHLAAEAEFMAPGYRWLMSKSSTREMPNYSHGSAGVAAFLVRAEALHPDALHLAGGVCNRLVELAGPDYMVHHHHPGGEDLYYWGWCHGPAGTSVLFSRMARRPGGWKWSEPLLRPAAAVRKSGLPKARLPGLWNNVGQCCGTAGVGSYLLRVVPKDPLAVAFCEALADDIRERATAEGDGLKWIQAEHRVRPDLLQAQVGWAQGASGIGLWFLELDGFLRGRANSFELPWTSVE